MKKTIFALSLGAVLTLGMQLPASAADAAVDSTLAVQESAKLAMRSAVAAAIGVNPTDVEIVMAPHLVTVMIVSSGYAVGSGADRETDAMKAAASIQQSFANRTEFSGVGAIHIGFDQRPSNDSKSLPSFDFFKSPAGEFVLHKS
jgi:hypothetical protein